MLRYRTEIMIAPDRYVCLQLPPGLPEGLATVIVVSHSSAAGVPTAALEENDVDRDDIEWWEEFDDDTGPATRA